MGKEKFDSFDIGIEQVLGEHDVPVGLKVFFGDTLKEFPGLGFSNIAGISTLGDTVEIEIAHTPTIKVRGDGWCVGIEEGAMLCA
ncbi:hypothetical protein KAR91_12090 [Candidatus Pacearchaeota archaeon]|nr:hypothetical protein [Candidatus Pacearchaeota archaeon]